MRFAPALLLLFSVAQAAAGASQPILLDFHADWCGPCKQMRPAVDALVAKGYPVKSIDIDRSPNLASKYKVEQVPTFIVIDEAGHELDRSSGSQPAGQLARFYLNARAQVEDDHEHADDDEDGPADEAPGPLENADEEPGLASKKVNPEPWETAVRIRVHGNGSIGFGSGTVIYSTKEESLILTCAHIFKLSDRKQAAPGQFPNPITVDLFDGRLKGPNNQQLTCIEKGIPAKAVDYDFGTDVGLIRIRPGRQLPYARVVPTHWEPQVRMHMRTVGCSEGRDATAWSTVITRPPTKMLPSSPEHVALECTTAPSQGRSGGGLYTDNGYIAGVCNFAEPRGNRGLYAAPESIYKLLNRNNLASLYAPASMGDPGTLLADAGSPGSSGRRSVAVARGQSPDRERETPRRSVRQGEVTLPSAELLGIQPITAADRRGSRTQIQAASERRQAWSPTHTDGDSPQASSRMASVPRSSEPVPTDLDLDDDVSGDHFPPAPFNDDQDEDRVNKEDLPTTRSRAKSAPSSSSTTSSPGWRPVKTSTNSSR